MSLNSSSTLIQTPTLSISAFNTPTHQQYSSYHNCQPNTNPQHQPTQHNNSLSTYFSSIKKQIQNQQLQNQQVCLKQVATIFINETQKDSNALIRVVIACVNLVCLILNSKKALKKEIIKCIINIRFIGCLLRFRVDRIMMQNPGIESSLCYLLQLCYEHRLFDCGKAKGLIELYKEYAFGLLRNISDSPKVVFNCLKIVDYLQRSNLISLQDYIRYDIIKTITSRTTRCKGDNGLVYELAYKIILNSNQSEEAIKLFSDLHSNCKSSSSQSFFKASSQSSKPLSSSSFYLILQQQLSQQQQQPSQRSQQSFYRFVRRQIQVLEPVNLVRLLEAGFVQNLLMKWISVVARNNVVEIKEFVSTIVTVQEKAKELMLEQTVKDKIISMIPFINQELSEPQGGRPSNEL